MEIALALLLTLCEPQSPSACHTIRHEFPASTLAEVCTAWGEQVKAMLVRLQFPEGERGAIACQTEFLL